MALNLKKSGKAVTVVDMDIVNPYFRSSDYTDFLKVNDIEIIAPVMAGTTLDTPSLAPQIMSVFEDKTKTVIFDVGGDDAGATALGRFSRYFNEEAYEMFFVINQFRKQIATPEACKEILTEIEFASHLKATAVINNSHFGEMTTADDIINSYGYAQRVADSLNLPLKLTTCENKLYEEIKGKIDNLYPLSIIVKLPWAV